MQTIHKYWLGLGSEQTIQVPIRSFPLCVQLQNNEIHVWIDHETTDPMITMTFYIVGTGNSSERVQDYKYLGTVQKDGFVWHIFYN